MPTEAENVQYLYLVLTSDGPPTIDWVAVGAALELKKGAVTKRWSRLKQSMEKGESPGGSTYQFLWHCVKHSTRDKPMNWSEIAEKCNTTPGAASKRYSRMKQAFEQGATPPSSSPTKNTPNKPRTTPKKTKGTASSGDDIEAAPTPKRKRASPKKKTPAADEQKFKVEPGDDDDGISEEDQKPKRAKSTKAKVTPKPKGNGKAKANTAVEKEANSPTPTAEATMFIKGEYEREGEDSFFDAQEQLEDLVEDLVDAEGEHKTDRVQDWLYSSA